MKFIISFLLFSLIITSSLVALTCSVDPYEKLGVNLFGFKTKAVAQSREIKFRMLESSRNDYGAFILGSSAAHRFNTETITKLTGLKAFNYAVQHSTPEDYQAMINHILQKNTPKLIYIQVGFNELNKNFQTDNRLYNSSLAHYLNDTKVREKTLFDFDYFTLAAIGDTFKVIWVNLFGKAAHNVYIKDGNYKKEKNLKGKVKLSQSSYPNYTISEERVLILKLIVQKLKRKDIKVKFFTSVLSIEHLNKIKRNPHLTKMHEQFLHQLKGLKVQFYDFHSQKLEDYNSTKFFRDSAHISKSFSDKILEDLNRTQNLEIGSVFLP